MKLIIITLIIVLIIKFLIHIYTVKHDLDIYMKNISDSEIISIGTIIMIAFFYIYIMIFGELNWLDGIGLKIFFFLCLLNIFIPFMLTRLFLAIHYKKHNYSIDYLKTRIKLEESKQNDKVFKSSALLAILSSLGESKKNKKNEKLEKEMDYNYLNDYEKELVRKGDYDPTNFEYPENEEELDEDDFYSDDDSYML